MSLERAMLCSRAWPQVTGILETAVVAAVHQSSSKDSTLINSIGEGNFGFSPSHTNYFNFACEKPLLNESAHKSFLAHGEYRGDFCLRL